MSIQEIFAFRKRLQWSVMLTVLAMLLLIDMFWPVHAAAPPITFGAGVTNAAGSLTTTLTWDAPGATGCVGSGHASWNGDKAASGTQQLPAITLSGTYALTLTCAFPGDTKAKVSWTPPTKNTDGSALTNLAGFKVLYGKSPTTLTNVEVIDNPAVTSRNIIDLTAGTWYFAARAVNSLNVESDLSNIVSKVITADTTQSASVSLTVNPKPETPTDTAVE